MTAKEGVSAKGNKTLKVEWVTPFRQFTTWFMPEARYQRALDQFNMWISATEDETVLPATVTYRKDPATNFFEIRAYNREPDHAPE
jgi:hypothetical protein